MKICLYSPYVPKHTGGGEKYFFDVAKTLVELGHDVYIGITCNLKDELTYCSSEKSSDPTQQISAHEEIRKRYEQFLDYSLAEIKFVQTPLNGLASFWQKLLWTRYWDVLYYATDGSLFFSLAKKNVLHIQIPFTDAKRSLIDRLKFFNWSVKNTNSGFTKQIIEKHWRTKVNYVHYPMIEAPRVSDEILAHKERIILHVGRFFRQLHSKRQDILVEIFKKMVTQYPQETTGWELVLIGSVEDEEYAADVAQAAENFSIRLLQVERSELWKFYQRASIYWHATGFGLDEMKEPAKMEHFGISTVEAMSMECVPIVIGQGGQVEVVGESLKEVLWKTEDECIQKTLEFITQPSLRQEKAKLARQQAQNFGHDRFKDTLAKMIQ